MAGTNFLTQIIELDFGRTGRPKQHYNSSAHCQGYMHGQRVT